VNDQQTTFLPKTQLDEAQAILRHLEAEEEKAEKAVDAAGEKCVDAQVRVRKQRSVIDYLQKQIGAPVADEFVEAEDAEIVDEDHQIEEARTVSVVFGGGQPIDVTVAEREIVTNLPYHAAAEVHHKVEELLEIDPEQLAGLQYAVMVGGEETFVDGSELAEQYVGQTVMVLAPSGLIAEAMVERVGEAIGEERTPVGPQEWLGSFEEDGELDPITEEPVAAGEQA
jgi:hypothetical protein